MITLMAHLVLFALGLVMGARCMLRRRWEELGLWVFLAASSLIGIGNAVTAAAMRLL